MQTVMIVLASVAVLVNLCVAFWPDTSPHAALRAVERGRTEYDKIAAIVFAIIWVLLLVVTH